MAASVKRLQTSPQIVTLFKTFSFLLGNCVDAEKVTLLRIVFVNVQTSSRGLPGSQRTRVKFA